MKAKKSLGQHFLRSEKALSRIIDESDPAGDDLILEIGPGEGVLTDRLLKFAGKVIAVEKDDKLYEKLKNKYQKEIEGGRLDLIHGDILDFDPNLLEFYSDLSYKIVANIPYNITGAILKKFLSAEYQPETMVLLLQREVAKRIVAADGKESILSISIKVYGKPRYVEMVKAGSFVPRPKVDSAIIAIEDISKDFFKKMAQNNNLEAELPSAEKKFFEMVKIGFGSKRKKLVSNLGHKYGKDKAEKAFSNINLDKNTRAEDISVETWKKLAEHLI